MTDASMARALGAWLPRQRWFAGKARTVTSVDVADTARIDDRLLVVIAEVGYADGGTERYHVPLAAGDGDVVARAEGRGWIDAVADPEACRRLAGMALDPTALPTARGARLVGRPVDARGEPEGRPRPLGAEQSNSSIVFGDRAILKLFRKLEPGVNPDVELTRGLTEAGFPHTPPQHGAVELDDGVEPTALAVLSAFVAGGREGWDLALEAVTTLAAGGDAGGRRTETGGRPHGSDQERDAGGRRTETGGRPHGSDQERDAGGRRTETGGRPHGSDLLDKVDDLGRAVAGAHAALANRFGRHRADRRDAAGWAATMTAQADTVLRTARERAPEQAAPVLARSDELLARLGAVGEVEDPGPLVRVHGDLHLGQVLLDRDGVWQLLDFEGEPARPLSERRAPHTPMRDVSGMLRSFDYAASHADPATPPPPAVARWRDEARARFLAGYREVAGAEGLLPTAPAAEAALLAAFELDKAVYELGYELASRPAWVPIPVAGIVRVLDGAEAGKPGVDDRTRGHAVAGTTTDWRAPADEVRALLDGTHVDPHRVLGAHEAGDGAVVRAYRPDAERVEVLVDGRDPVEAKRTDERGFFEARLPARPDPTGYRLRVAYPGGATFELRDPYAFWPSLGEIDVHLAGEGRHEELWRRMGAHVVDRDGVTGVTFAVWAPNARGVRVVGDFNSWDGRLNPMRRLGGSGIWELFVPDVSPGARYKYEIVTPDGTVVTRADPYAFATERPPGTASRIHRTTYQWGDDRWLAERRERNALYEPMSVYEVHLGSWRHEGEGGDQGDGTPLGYRELAHALADHATALGFTHVELLPVAEHPFGGSWGYQVTGYYAPTARFGDPDDFRYFVDHLHRSGLGVIVDWVPAHFPKDEWALARFDGSALYEHADPRQGEHPDWGTLVFNYGRNEVRNFLIANALYWIEELHVDGLRVDAVASMLYLDYSRKAGEWVPNRYGGRENLEAVDFLKQLNAVVHGRNPGVLMVAEESTAWPGVSRPVHLGGLGFGFKWNMGWMHDTLSYFSHDPIHRRYHHHQLTFGLMYAWSENFVLPLSHDEVVHGKRSLLDKMPGDRWRKFANLRALYAYMWAHPGKQLLFMGDEFGQWREWSEERSLDWYLLGEDDHAGLQRLVGDLNAVYRANPALWQRDDRPEGFAWIDANDADHNVLSFVRYSDDAPPVVCIANLSPIARDAMRVGLPSAGPWRELLNTDAGTYGGSNVGNLGSVQATAQPWHGMPASAGLTLPPLGVLWLVPDG